MPGAIINPSSSSGGTNNLVTVADITTRNLEPHDQDILFKVLDASDDPKVDAGWALYQWNIGLNDWQKIAEEESSDIVPASESAAGVVRMATDIEAASGASGVAITPAQAIARIQALGVEFVGGASYSPADPDELELDYPAANYNGKWSVCRGTTEKETDGGYKSNGTNWIKQWDVSSFSVGDRTLLPSYDDSVLDLSENLMYGGTTVSNYTEPNIAAIVNDNNSNATSAMTVNRIVGVDIGYDNYYKLNVAIGGYTAYAFKIVGLTVEGGEADAGNWENVSLTSITKTGYTGGAGTANFTLGGDGYTITGAYLGSTIYNLLYDCVISGTKKYYAYGVKCISHEGNAGTGFSVWQIRGYKLSGVVSPNTNCVNDIVLLNTRLETLEAAGLPASSIVADSAGLAAITGMVSGDRVEVTNYAGTGITEVVEWSGSAWVIVTDEVTANKALALAQSVVGSAGAVELYVANAATGTGSGADASNYMSWATFAATYGGTSSSYNKFNPVTKIFIHFPSNETITTDATNKYFNNLDLVLIPTNNLTFQTNYLYFNSCKIRAVSSSYTITTAGIFFKGCKIDLASYHLTSTGTIDFYECDTVICNNLTAVNINIYASKVVCYDLSASSNLACYYLSELLCYNTIVCGAGLADEFARIKTITINSTSSFVLTTGSIIVYNTNSGTAPTTGDASAFVYDV